MLFSRYRKSVKRRSDRPGRARARFRPQLQALEERVVPSTFTEVEPNGSASLANVVPIEVGDILASPADSWLNISGTVGTTTDQDWFRFTLTARSGVFFDLDSREVGLSSTLNSFVTVLNSSGTTTLGSNDNGYDFLTGWPAPFAQAGVTTADAALYLDLTPGEYLVRVHAPSGTTGNYVLRLLADSTFSSTVPALNSNPGAPATVFLDFDGHSSTSDAWVTRPGSPGPYAIAAFDFNGNGAEWSPAERLTIYNVWRITAEDFAPFRVNISTNYTGLFNDRVGFRQVIGGLPAQIGEAPSRLGVAFLNSFGTGGASNNTAFTFAANFTQLFNGGISGLISGRANQLAHTSSHEVGHALGLQHYTMASQQTALMITPNPGLRRSTWWQGINEFGATQNDLSTITNATNAFGYRPDDHGSAIGTATVLTPSGDTYFATGNIAQLADLDFFRITASGSTTIVGYQDYYISNLDIRLRVFDAAGTLVATADPSTDFNASLTLSLAAGTYYVEVASSGGPGEVGTYNLSVTGASGGGPEIEVLVDGVDLADDIGIVDYGTTTVGTPVDRTFVVRNVGKATLTIGPTITLPVGISLGAVTGSGTLLPGQEVSFVLRLDATAAGTVTGMVSFGTNDADENPFNFTVTGTVIDPVPTVVIVDDGDPGFDASAGFVPLTGQGFQDDVRLAAPGSGSEWASWNVTGLSPGVYQVSVTWTAEPGRATNAPFFIYDGETLLAVVLVNQELVPADLDADGASWHHLGTFTITTGSLLVLVTDEADEFVVADAIRIERLGDLTGGQDSFNQDPAPDDEPVPDVGFWDPPGNPGPEDEGSSQPAGQNGGGCCCALCQVAASNARGQKSAGARQALDLLANVQLALALEEDHVPVVAAEGFPDAARGSLAAYFSSTDQ